MSRINVDCLMFPNSVFGGACLDSDDLVIFYGTRTFSPQQRLHCSVETMQTG